MTLPALSPGAQFSADMLPHVKHRALPPLNIFCGRLQRPVSDILYRENLSG